MLMFVIDYLKAWWYSSMCRKENEVPLNGIIEDAVPEIGVVNTYYADDGAMIGVVEFPDGQKFNCLFSESYIVTGMYSLRFVEPSVFAFHKGFPKTGDIVIGETYGLAGKVDKKTVMYGGDKVKEEFLQKLKTFSDCPVIVHINRHNMSQNKKGE